MRKQYLWLNSVLLTIANIVLLLLTYFLISNNIPATTVQFSTRPQPVDASSGVATVYPTPTPMPHIKVVQALQNIPRGYRFPNTIPELENIAGYAILPEITVPFNAIKEQDGGLEKLLGNVARTDIFREQPILSTYLVNDLTNLAITGSDIAAIIPKGIVAKMIRLPREDLLMGISVGDYVNVFYTDIRGVSGTNISTKLLVDNAKVLFIGEIPPNGRIFDFATSTPVPASYEYDQNSFYNPTLFPSPTPKIESMTAIVLGVTDQDAGELIWAEQQNVPLSIVIRSVNDHTKTNVNPIEEDTLLP